MKTLAELEGKSGIVVLQHKLFGRQKIEVEAIEIIDDDKRLGLKIKNNNIFIPKQNIIICQYCANDYIIASEIQKIIIIVNKL